MLATTSQADAVGQLRQWTDSSGSFQIRARLLNVAQDVVHLQREDGRVVQVPVEELSDDDRQYVERTADTTNTPSSLDDLPQGDSATNSHHSARR